METLRWQLGQVRDQACITARPAVTYRRRNIELARNLMQAIATGYGLIEGPVWDRTQGLYFSDVVNGGIYLLDRTDRVLPAFPKRRGIGGMALHASGGLVAGGREIILASLPDKQSRILLDAKVATGAVGFNDLTTDSRGRIYVGSLAYRVVAGESPKPGHLYVIELDGTARSVSDGVMLSNGLGFSPDGKCLYHSDTRSGLVRAYDVADDGALGPWRTFATMTMPDGLKVAADGSVWVADARGGRVAVFERDGRSRIDIRVPLPMVTSLCFGGDDLRDLYIVTGSRGGPQSNCGTIYRMRADVPGVAVAPARVEPV
jgi:xylono-1,5-lactonase